MTWAGQEELFSVDPVGAPPGPAGWLEVILEADQTWRRSAAARLAPCRRCAALVFSAADSTWDGAADVVVDPRLLDRGLEVQALVGGRGTAELEPARHGGGPRVFSRDRWLVAREPNARRRLWVPEHKCNDVIGWELPLEIVYPLESRLWNLEHRNDLSNECPF